MAAIPTLPNFYGAMIGQSGNITVMASKDFIRQRICIYAGRDIDPVIDKQVTDMLLSKFNIQLPQRASLNDSLAAAISDHEILQLILQYRTMV